MGETSQKPSYHLLLLIVFSSCVFFILFFLGALPGVNLISDSRCYSLLGCNAGFFGYDALEHFVSGILCTLFIIWYTRKFPEHNPFQKTFLRNVVILFSLIALYGVFWEMLEFVYDHVRIDIFHMNLFHPNNQAQPTNSDTMGDLSFNFLGSLFVLIIARLRKINIFI